MRTVIAVILIAMSLSGCAEIPIKDGELVVGKDTTAGIDDIGVGHLTNKF